MPSNRRRYGCSSEDSAPATFNMRRDVDCDNNLECTGTMSPLPRNQHCLEGFLDRMDDDLSVKAAAPQEGEVEASAFSLRRLDQPAASTNTQLFLYELIVHKMRDCRGEECRDNSGTVKAHKFDRLKPSPCRGGDDKANLVTVRSYEVPYFQKSKNITGFYLIFNVNRWYDRGEIGSGF